MNKNTFNIALIGCGRVTKHHIKSINQTSKLKLIAVCDLVEEKARNYATEFNLQYFQNYHTMLSQMPEIDIVGIITPSGIHAEQALEIIQRYRKHVLIEKPPFLRLEDIDTVFSVAEKYNCKVFPVFQNRYNPAVQRVKKAIEQNELGEIRTISVRVRWCRPQRYYDLAPWRGTFSLDGGVLSNQGIHHIDLLYFLGGKVTKVNAVLCTQEVNIEVENTAVATLNYASNSVGSIEITTAARPIDYEASISIVGSKGLAQIGGLAVNELQIFTPKPEDCLKYSQEILDGYGFGHINIYYDIVKDLSNEYTFPISKTDCTEVLQLLHAFYLSDEEGISISPSKSNFSKRLGKYDKVLFDFYRTRDPLIKEIQ